ncbi:MAG: hypothetical protein EZS28_047425, partial [Streblomastix strix]
FEVYSATSKKRLGEIKKMQGQDFQIFRFSHQYQNNQLGRNNQKTFRRSAIYQKGKGQSQGAPNGKDFKRGWRYNRQQGKSDDERRNQDGHPIDQLSGIRLQDLLHYLLRRFAKTSNDGLIFSCCSASTSTSRRIQQSPLIASLDSESAT